VNVLFICNAGRNRSKTAAELWSQAHPKDKVKHVGIINIDNPDLFHWADKIICFGERIKKRVLAAVFDDIKVYLKIEVWEIPDLYNYGDSKLVELLKQKIK